MSRPQEHDSLLASLTSIQWPHGPQKHSTQSKLNHFTSQVYSLNPLVALFSWLTFFSAVLSPDFSVKLYASLRSSWLAFCASFFAFAFSLAAATFSLTALTGVLATFFSTPLGAASRAVFLVPLFLVPLARGAPAPRPPAPPAPVLPVMVVRVGVGGGLGCDDGCFG